MLNHFHYDEVSGGVLTVSSTSLDLLNDKQKETLTEAVVAVQALAFEEDALMEPSVCLLIDTLLRPPIM